VKPISRTIWALGVVSFFTDLSSEMIYPLLPIFLTTTLGASAAALGLIEGIAEATAAILKVFSGVWTDHFKRRKPLIIFGYSLAGLMRPLIGIATSWGFVLCLRFFDRVGKGIRTAPRDALIADLATPETRGRAYSIQRILDHAGAVGGPLIALLLLKNFGLSLREIFLLAAIPAAAGVYILTKRVQEAPEPNVAPKEPFRIAAAFSEVHADFLKFLGILFIFTLANSTDAFLILRMTDAGLTAESIVLLWALLHIVKMCANYFGGRACDRFGARKLIVVSWLYFAVMYAAFGLTVNLSVLIGIFLAYGIFYGLSEPAERAFVAGLAKDKKGAAFGLYNFVSGVALLPASLLFGFLWKTFNFRVPFLVSAALAILAMSAFLFTRSNNRT
jgi:MFS family permease